ncbi:MAG: DoxX family protein [Patescibacteria group bacterium]|nr:DoxX family protein [Patescibacteria group bacterium]
MQQSVHIPEPKVARFLWGDTRIAWLWLLVRLYAGWDWLTAGWEKLHMPSWVGAQSGTAVNGFLSGALGKASGPNPAVSSWYAFFIRSFAANHVVFLSYLVAWGEFLVGAALILGVFTGIAAFFGAFMNINYLFAGTVSVNPMLLLLELVLMFAWRTAGWWGIDRWLLPELGVPWKPGKAFE